MRDQQSRDDLQHHRLFSFLALRGELPIEKVAPIKRHVFRIKTNDNLKNDLILKAHQNERQILKQWAFFEKIDSEAAHLIPFKKFPNGARLVKHQRLIWTISPFTAGRQLNYRKDEDRENALTTLEKFHQQATNIFIQPVEKKTLIIEKWHQRFKAFKKTVYFFEQHGFENLYNDIEQSSRQYLTDLQRMPWSLEEIRALQKGVWIHGDVASHNFIKAGSSRLIDFDLLRCGPQIYDYIQLGQRYLPYIGWDLEKLLSYDMVPSSQFKLWLMGILMPSDVMREWIHFLTHQSSLSIPAYLANMERKWLKRKKFSQSVQLMLKS